MDPAAATKVKAFLRDLRQVCCKHRAWIDRARLEINCQELGRHYLTELAAVAAFASCRAEDGQEIDDSGIRQ